MPRIAAQRKEPSDAQIAARTAGAERLRAAAAERKLRKVAPVVIRKETAAPAEQVDAGVATPGEGAEINLTVREIEVPHMKHVSKEKLERLRFFAEKVKIVIHDTAEEQADPRFSVWVNGREWIFVRGLEYTVPRYVVEGLCRAKPVGFTNQEYVKEDGTRSVRWPTKTGLRYGFSVVEDSEKGREWLKVSRRMS